MFAPGSQHLNLTFRALNDQRQWRDPDADHTHVHRRVEPLVVALDGG